MKIDIFNSLGKKIDKYQINDNIDKFKIAETAVYNSVVNKLTRKRQGSHQTKDKSEIRGGGKKPWRQKGTGRARHGSIRSPIWRGGGVVFGPTNKKNYRPKLNKKIRNIAFKSVIKNRILNNNVFVIDKFNFEKPSTKKINNILNNFEIDNKSVLFISHKNNAELNLSCRNIRSIKCIFFDELSVLNLITGKKLIFELDSFKKIEEKF